MDQALTQKLCLPHTSLSALRPVYVCASPHGKFTEDEANAILDKYGLAMREHLIPPSPDVQPHQHEYYEVALVLQGMADHVFPGGEQRLERGSVAICPPGRVHQYVRVESFLVINIMYVAEWLSDDLKTLCHQPALLHLFLSNAVFRQGENTPLHHVQLSDAQLERCVMEIAELYRELRLVEPSSVYLRCCLLKVLILLSRAYLHERPCPFHGQIREEIWTTLDDIEDGITGGRTIDVAALSKRLDMGPDHFSRVFRAATGWSPREYYQRRRAQHAACLLLHHEYDITEVAHMLGYSDSPHLSRFFRRYYGCSPRAYRQRLAPLSQ